MPRYIQILRFTGNSTSPDYSFNLEPVSWTPNTFQVTGVFIGTAHTGYFYDPSDARTLGQPQTPNLAEHATYRYYVCPANQKYPPPKPLTDYGEQCAPDSTIRIPMAPPDPPTQVSICPLKSGQVGQPCASVGATMSEHGITITARVPNMGESVGNLSPSPTGPNSPSGGANVPGRLPNIGAGSVGTVTRNLTGYVMRWPAADRRTTKIDIQRYDPKASGDHWTEATTARSTDTSAYLPPLVAPDLSKTYRVCFRGEAYNNSAFPVSSTLAAFLANICSPPITVAVSFTTSPHYVPPTALQGVSALQNAVVAGGAHGRELQTIRPRNP